MGVTGSQRDIEVGQHNDEHEHSPPRAQHDGDSSCDVVIGDVIYANSKTCKQQDMMKKEEVHIPSQQQKQKTKNECAETERACCKVEKITDNDDDGKTVTSTTRNDIEVKGATDERNIHNDNGGYVQSGTVRGLDLTGKDDDHF